MGPMAGGYNDLAWLYSRTSAWVSVPTPPLIRSSSGCVR